MRVRTCPDCKGIKSPAARRCRRCHFAQAGRGTIDTARAAIGPDEIARRGRTLSSVHRWATREVDVCRCGAPVTDYNVIAARYCSERCRQAGVRAANNAAGLRHDGRPYARPPVAPRQHRPARRPPQDPRAARRASYERLRADPERYAVHLERSREGMRRHYARQKGSADATT